MSGGSDIVLVTGVSGFVGSAVARALAQRGATVRGLVRSSSPRANLANFPGTLVEGDARDPAAMARAMAGARHLYHVAADYRIWAPDTEEIVRNNLAGAQVVMVAAREAGVERVVYTSSVATLKPPENGKQSGGRLTRPALPHPKMRSARTSAARSWPSGWSRRWWRKACRR